MKIVRQDEFVKLPAGMVYAEVATENNRYLDLSLKIKGDTIIHSGFDGAPNDWFLVELSTIYAQNCEEDGDEEELDFTTESRHGEYNSDETLIAVFDEFDVANLIERLQKAYVEGYVTKCQDPS